MARYRDVLAERMMPALDGVAKNFDGCRFCDQDDVLVT